MRHKPRKPGEDTQEFMTGVSETQPIENDVDDALEKAQVMADKTDWVPVVLAIIFCSIVAVIASACGAGVTWKILTWSGMV